MFILAHLLIELHICPHTLSITYLLISLLSGGNIYLMTYLYIYLLTHTYLLTCSLTYLLTYLLTKLLTYLLTYLHVVAAVRVLKLDMRVV